MNIEKEISDNSRILVYFWAPWCNPCKSTKPIVEEMMNEINDVKIVKCNLDDNPQMAAKYGIKSIPTFIYFKDGDVSDVMVGISGKDKLLNLIER